MKAQAQWMRLNRPVRTVLDKSSKSKLGHSCKNLSLLQRIWSKVAVLSVQKSSNSRGKKDSVYLEQIR